MKYVGSKNKISKELAPIIQSYITDQTVAYLEPFVGGANMIDKIQCKRKIGCDIHEELIELLKATQRDDLVLPNSITEGEYNAVRNNKENYDKWYVGLVGFCATFGSKYFGGYARGFKADKVTPRDIPNEAIRNLKEQIPKIKDVKFKQIDFRNISEDKIKGYVIYCDPPYENTTEYKTDSFPHKEFWEWCRRLSSDNVVLVSEYKSPEDFICIWEKKVTTSLKVHEHEDRMEKLFVHNTHNIIS